MQPACGMLLPPVQKLVATIIFCAAENAIESGCGAYRGRYAALFCTNMNENATEYAQENRRSEAVNAEENTRPYLLCCHFLMCEYNVNVVQTLLRLEFLEQ